MLIVVKRIVFLEDGKKYPVWYVLFGDVVIEEFSDAKTAEDFKITYEDKIYYILEERIKEYLNDDSEEKDDSFIKDTLSDEEIEDLIVSSLDNIHDMVKKHNRPKNRHRV